MAQRVIKSLFDRAAIKGVKASPHTLRHTFGTLTMRYGLDAFSCARLLRHRLPHITSHYVHLSLDDLRQELERYSPIRLANGAQQELGKILT